jgi:hypothetical protein
MERRIIDRYKHHELSHNKTHCCCYLILGSFLPFFHKDSSEMEEIRGPYGKCGQKSIIESDHKDRIDYLPA